MSVTYINVQGITEACKKFRSKITDFDNCVSEMDMTTIKVLENWVGKGRNQFETQMRLMNGQLKDISEALYDISQALADAEEAYIDEDEEMAKQLSISQAQAK